MKRLITIAIVLSMGLCTFAQNGGGMLKRSKEYQETYRNTGQDRSMYPKMPEFGESGDGNADSPLGGGITVLLGLGTAYLVAKRRKQE